MTLIGAESGILVNYETDTDFDPHKLDCTKELATYPTTKCLRIIMGKGLKLKKESGVTVKDVLQAVGNMWEEPPSQCETAIR